MRNKANSYYLLWMVCLPALLLASPALHAQDFSVPENRVLINGDWKINEKLSDVTDTQVEAAIKRAGGKVERRWFKGGEKEFYRGGPAEQEMYDRISYDMVLSIHFEDPEFQFVYADNFTRVFHSDARRRSTDASTFYKEGAADFSFAQWEANALIVEARPRDGGFTMETYTLHTNNQQLHVKMLIEPDNFGAAISLTRVYDRVITSSTPQ